MKFDAKVEKISSTETSHQITFDMGEWYMPDADDDGNYPDACYGDEGAVWAGRGEYFTITFYGDQDDTTRFGPGSFHTFTIGSHV